MTQFNSYSTRESGHGTYVDGDEVIASVAGTIERVNKLVTVRTLRGRRVPSQDVYHLLTACLNFSGLFVPATMLP